MIRIIGDLIADWNYLDERIEKVTDQIEGRRYEARVEPRVETGNRLIEHD